MTEVRLENNLRFAKERIKELENETQVLTNDNNNLRLMVKSLEEKQKYLVDKLVKL